MKQYIVYITHYKGNKLPPFYIGSSYEEKIKKGYNGTIKSKKWASLYKEEQKENKHLFRTKVLSYHETREEALREELRLQKKHLVVKNDRYFNESYAQVKGYFGRDVNGKNNPMYNKKHNKNTLTKMLNTRKQNNSYITGSIKAKETRDDEWYENIGAHSYNNMVNTRKQNNSYITGAVKAKETKDKNNTWKKAEEKRIKTMDKNNPKYKIYHIDGTLKNKEITQRELRKIHDRLRYTNKKKYFGYSPQSKSRLINGGFEHLIGLYAIKI